MRGLITIPLAFLSVMVLFSYVFNGNVAQSWGKGSLGLLGATPVVGQEDISFWDKNGHALVYSNGSAVGELGEVRVATGIQHLIGHCYWTWHNNSVIDYQGSEYVWSDTVWYACFDNPNGNDETGSEVQARIDALHGNDVTFGWIAGGQFGMVAMGVAVISCGALAGLHVFGTGISDSSVDGLVKGGALLSMFFALTLGAYNVFVQIPVFGWVIYFALTAMYMLGIVNTIGHGGVD